MSDIENQQPRDHTLAVGSDSDPVAIHDDNHEITKVHTDGDYITFGNERYLRSELVEAFGGTLNPGLSPPPKHDFANPAPLGLCGFAMTTFVLSLINLETRGVKIPNIVVGLAYFYGGLAQLVAGMFEIAVGNTFGGAALSSYGSFWGTWAAIYTPSFGIQAAYMDPETGELNAKEFANAVGIYLVGWFIFTFFMMLMTLKSTLAFFLVFFLLSITFLLLAIAEFKGTNGGPVKKAAGVFGLLTAFAAWYNAYAGIANEQNSYITVKALPLPDLQAKHK
ncbi:accumulation of dyads protein 2 [Diutina catenulata]